MQERLRRLEAVVFAKDEPPTTATGSSSVVEFPVRHGTTTSSPDTESANGYGEIVKELESFGYQDSTTLPRVAQSLTPQIDTLANIVLRTSSNSPAIILLPRFEESLLLIQRWREHLDALEHILHVPTVKKNTAVLFDAIAAGLPLSPPMYSSLAVLLAVIANITEYWTLGGDDKDSIFPSRAAALTVAKYWLRSGLDVLEHVWRTTGPDVGTIQAKILFMFFIFHMEGFSVKGRHMMSSAVSDARNIGLHMTDAPRSKVRGTTQDEIIDVEIRRRVWWHLVSTDWSAALLVGPYDGVYTVHPHHMQVKRPRNITNEDLATKPADFERPATELTSTTYYLSRIVLGSICREVADTLMQMQSASDISSIPYGRILALDRKFVELIEGLPETLRLEGDVVLKPSQVDTGSRNGPNIKQRYFTYLTTEARRCKLHLPYLFRVQQNPDYTFSRETCLQSARNILRLRRVLPSEISNLPCSVKMTGLLHHFCCAIIILVMDLCVNKSVNDADDAMRKEEIVSACKLVEDAKETSPVAASFSGSVDLILNKHNIQLRPEEHGGTGSPRVSKCAQGKVPAFGAGFFPPSLDRSVQVQDTPDYDLDMGIDFDAMWQSYLEFDSGLGWDGSLDMDGSAFTLSGT
ncbi:hypothetical protein LTR86_010332 [Recurvomyces mirabilis]|nr:hypothetical protein LTR86_010332 [Recurvomyces mirabilis]